MPIPPVQPRSGPISKARQVHPPATGLAASVEKLSERQRHYLQLVRQNRSSKEIAALTGSSYRAVDKQLLKANNILGVANRFEAARLLAEHEEGVEGLHPANALPSTHGDSALSRPWPTVGAAANTLSLRQVVSWTAIIAIVTPIGLAAAGLAYFTLLLLLRLGSY
ncbi:response regulator transcription factor [Sphingomonas pokkalii]|uniref:RNA polymerase subunit sigma-70 n=1 Tax=Sphingomonas pokkalii TaxID=2175090 RepID=A0A2U0SBW7_9SPHN|nr:helix-turn-helix domain-containing protein [Sphingomonas pokkalii]PVX28859.1 RNA polymerase subunit sigma-70 [Sphingomonas pokkalii]